MAKRYDITPKSEYKCVKGMLKDARKRCNYYQMRIDENYYGEEWNKYFRGAYDYFEHKAAVCSDIINKMESQKKDIVRLYLYDDRVFAKNLPATPEVPCRTGQAVV